MASDRKKHINSVSKKKESAASVLLLATTKQTHTRYSFCGHIFVATKVIDEYPRQT
jgi:hypothetical protein